MCSAVWRRKHEIGDGLIVLARILEGEAPTVIGALASFSPFRKCRLKYVRIVACHRHRLINLFKNGVPSEEAPRFPKDHLA
jgi:hypothetical protein